MLIGFIDFYHFIPLSVTLSLAGVTKLGQSKVCWHRFFAHFSTDQDERCVEVCQVEHSTTFESDVTKGSYCCFTDCLKKL